MVLILQFVHWRENHTAQVNWSMGGLLRYFTVGMGWRGRIYFVSPALNIFRLTFSVAVLCVRSNFKFFLTEHLGPAHCCPFSLFLQWVRCYVSFSGTGTFINVAKLPLLWLLAKTYGSTHKQPRKLGCLIRLCRLYTAWLQGAPFTWTTVEPPKLYWYSLRNIPGKPHLIDYLKISLYAKSILLDTTLNKTDKSSYPQEAYIPVRGIHDKQITYGHICNVISALHICNIILVGDKDVENKSGKAKRVGGGEC